MVSEKTAHSTENIADSIRLNKFIASQGVCSRRQADTLIEQGKVTINGTVVTELGARVVPSDTVIVEGQDISVTIASAGTVDGEYSYIILHKPIEVISTVKDPQGRTTVLDILPPEFKKHRVYPVGRLDYFSEGLILLTNNGELANRLTHPKWEHSRTYIVKVRGNVSPSKIEDMQEGMTLEEGEKLAPIEVQLLEADHRSSLLKLVLHQGLNRQIRRMCRDLDLTILMLRRVQHGVLNLGELPKGKARMLSKTEQNILLKSVGL